ncbi:hypothetical protein, partial [Blautia sp. MCC283]|uniref:hypothetical protein n=1 Tax=Blautia sp. MCC283 TaxID=2592640 RepID=UPI001C039B37
VAYHFHKRHLFFSIIHSFRIINNDSIGNMCCQATKNALYLAGYALFGCEIFLNTPPGFLFSPIRGHKNGQAFAIMNEKGDCNYA